MFHEATQHRRLVQMKDADYPGHDAEYSAFDDADDDGGDGDSDDGVDVRE